MQADKMALTTAASIVSTFGDWIISENPFSAFSTTKSLISSPAAAAGQLKMDRGYGYGEPPRSPARIVQGGRSSNTSLSSRDYYDRPNYYDPRSSGERILPPRNAVVPRTADDYDIPRRGSLDPRSDHRARGHSMNPTADRRPLHIIAPVASDRLRPAIHSATVDRRGSDARDYRDPHYILPASSSRSGHGRHLSAEVDDRGRYFHAGRPERLPQYHDPGRHHAPDSKRWSDERLERRAIEPPPPPPSHHRHLLHDHALRPRAGSDVGARPSPGPEYVRNRPREGPPPSSRGFDRINHHDRGPVTQTYRIPREETGSVSSSSGPYQDDRDRRHSSQRPIAVNQDYEYGYSSADEPRGDRDRHRQRPYHEDTHSRHHDTRYDSDAEYRRRRPSQLREPSSRRDARPERDEPDQKQTVASRHHKRDSEDKRYHRDEDDRRPNRSSKEYVRTEDDERRHRRRDERREERREDRRSDEDSDTRRGENDDRSRHIAEAIGLGGAGTALVGIARSAFKKKAKEYGFGGESEDDRERDGEKRDRYGGDTRRRRRDETEEERKERKERHRRRREQETEEETQERRRRHRERKDRRERGEGDRNAERSRDGDANKEKDRTRDRAKDGEWERDKDRDRPSSGGDDRDKNRQLLGADLAGAAGGAAGGALVPHRDKSRTRDKDGGGSRDLSRDPHSRDASRRRRPSKRRGSESDTTESSSSDSEVDNQMALRPRANSSARPAPAKGILKTPTVRFPEDQAIIREGVAPLKDAKSQKGIPPNARWTAINRKLVNPDALREAQERFEERLDKVIVLRVLTHEEIEKFARRTQELREQRHQRNSHEAEVEERERREQEQMDRESRDRAPLAIDNRPHNPETEAENAVQFAVDHRNGEGSHAPSPVPLQSALDGQRSQPQQRQMEAPNDVYRQADDKPNGSAPSPQPAASG